LEEEVVTHAKLALVGPDGISHTIAEVPRAWKKALDAKGQPWGGSWDSCVEHMRDALLDELPLDMLEDVARAVVLATNPAAARVAPWTCCGPLDHGSSRCEEHEVSYDTKHARLVDVWYDEGDPEGITRSVPQCQECWEESTEPVFLKIEVTDGPSVILPLDESEDVDKAADEALVEVREWVSEQDWGDTKHISLRYSFYPESRPEAKLEGETWEGEATLELDLPLDDEDSDDDGDEG
jgi:hypothetical protein